MSHLVVINNNKYMTMKIIKKYYDKKQSGGECIILGESVLLN